MVIQSKRHRLKISYRFLALVCLLVCLIGTAYSPRVARAQGDDYQAIIDGSKTESDGLLIYSSLSDKTWAPLVSAFNEKYPWIKVTTAESTNFDVFDSYYQESDQAVRTADLLVSSDYSQWDELQSEGNYQEYVSIENDNLPDFAKDEKHLYLLASNPLVMVWNKKLVKTPPTGLDTLATLIEDDPAGFSGQVETIDASRSVTGFEVYWFYLQNKGEAGWTLLERLGKASIKPVVNSEKMVEDVLQGKAKIAFFVEASAMAQYIGEDTDLGWAPIQDGMPIVEYLMGITQNASSPDSARLFVDFALSKEGQIALARSGLPAYREDLQGTATLHESQFFDNVPEDKQIYFDGDKASTDDNTQETFIERWKSVFKIE